MPLSPNNRSCAPDTSAARDFGHRSAAGHVDRTAAHVNQGAIPVSCPSRSTAPRAYKERVPAGWRGSNRGSGVSSSARTATGFDSSSHPPQAGFGATSTSGSRADPRERGPPCVMQVNRTPVPMAVSSPSGGLHRHEHDGCPTTIVETNHSFEDSRAVGQGREVRAELDSAVLPDD